MSRHIIDHAAPKAEGNRVKHFVHLAHEEGVHPAVQALTQRSTSARTGRKAEAFLRIEREGSAG